MVRYVVHVDVLVPCGVYACSFWGDVFWELFVFSISWLDECGSEGAYRCLSCSFGLVLLPFGSLAIVAGVGGMWYMVVPLGSVVLVIRAFHWVTPVSHSGARGLSSLLE